MCIGIVLVCDLNMGHFIDDPIYQEAHEEEWGELGSMTHTHTHIAVSFIS